MCRGKSWPFKIFVKTDGVVHRYQPKSDFGYTTINEATPMPVMIGEVASITSGADRYRMLCQGIAETRALNCNSRQDVFVIMAVYVTDQLIAERYLLFPHRENDRRVSVRLGLQNSKPI